MMNKVEQVVVLCAGKGERMGSKFRHIQKCALSINGIPLIVQGTRNLLMAGIKEVILLTGHKAKQIEDCFLGTPYTKHLKFVFCGDPYRKPLNTLSTIANVEPYIQGPFLCVHGDILFDYSIISDIQDIFSTRFPLMIIAVSHRKYRAPTHTRVEYDDNLVVKDIKDPKVSDGDVWMGVDLYDPYIISKCCSNPELSCQKDLARMVLSEGQEIRVVQYKQDWVHITTMADLLSWNDIFEKTRRLKWTAVSGNRR